MSIHKHQPQTLDPTSRQDSALNVPNASLRDTQGTFGAEVTMGSDCGSCKEALGRRSTRVNRDAGERVPSKLGDVSSGLVVYKKQVETFRGFIGISGAYVILVLPWDTIFQLKLDLEQFPT